MTWLSFFRFWDYMSKGFWVKRWWNWHLIFLDEGDEGGSLDLDGLTRSVVEGDDEVEEVGLPQVGGWLLLEVGPSDARSNAKTEISKTDSRSGLKFTKLLKISL